MVFIWQCACGHIEHSTTFPEDCPKCLRVGEFEKIPEDQLQEKQEESILALQPGDEDEEDLEDEY